jgi:hypothetical protein
MKQTTKNFLKTPPQGSKTRDALNFGIDLTLTVRNMFILSPFERLERLQNDQLDIFSSKR